MGKDQPKQPDSTMRDTKFYQETLKLLQWQRDNYMVGQDFAERRQIERQSAAPTIAQDNVSIDQAAAMQSQQLVNLAAWFIPTQTVQQALVPLVISLPSGLLKEPITTGFVNLISEQQQNLDDVFKENLTYFFMGDHWREFVKDSASRYITVTFDRSGRRT